MPPLFAPRASAAWIAHWSRDIFSTKVNWMSHNTHWTEWSRHFLKCNSPTYVRSKYITFLNLVENSCLQQNFVYWALCTISQSWKPYPLGPNRIHIIPKTIFCKVIFVQNFIIVLQTSHIGPAVIAALIKVQFQSHFFPQNLEFDFKLPNSLFSKELVQFCKDLESLKDPQLSAHSRTRRESFSTRNY